MFLARDNNTGGGDDAIFPHGWYGTAARFAANKNGSAEVTMALGNSLPSSNGGVYLPLSGATNDLAATESIGSASGVLTFNYNASINTLTGCYNGIPVGSYSLAGWGFNPPLTIVVWGGSGAGVAVSAGTDTAGNFSASLVPAHGALILLERILFWTLADQCCRVHIAIHAEPCFADLDHRFAIADSGQRAEHRDKSNP